MYETALEQAPVVSAGGNPATAATFYRLCAYCNRLPTLVLDAGEPLELVTSVAVRVVGNTLTATGSDTPAFGCTSTTRTTM